ncbi:sugar ABC transporter ATP-binding protein [Maritalea myrionectae]|uniref:sugar ABC transporter ATP-binding protein n=1 Tax=Maritalea myrionectae TaxID=454601 RepID=UPI0004254F62|nr:sugar ABC transporter ATP-binding protein [Maritalea myrionectae]
MPQSEPILRMAGISKSFGATQALQDVDFSCFTGSIHAILGENGAGKSTLIKIMSGVLDPTAGELFVEGGLVNFQSPTQAAKDGVVCIFQELSLVPDLSVADNIFLDSPPKKWGLIDKKTQREQARVLLARIKCGDIDPRALVKDLSLSRRQMVEIAKALSKKPKVLILDEATSALSSQDVDTIYGLLGELKDEGVCCLFISHKMHEVERLCDTLSVFRNGKHIETFAKGAKSDDEIVKLMIGRTVDAQFPAKPPPKDYETRLSIRDLKWERQLKGVDLTLGRGEIVGLGGLDGQGQKELLLALFGVLRSVEGEVRVDDQIVHTGSPAEAKASPTNFALVPEDRKTEGLMLPMSIADNLMIASLDKISDGPVVSPSKEKEAVANGIKQLEIKVGSPHHAVSTLSGGNQQKVVIAKWLCTNPDIVLLNDPTRGIDVGTKQEIYKLIRALADEGKSILLYSTDYDELIGCCDRVAVMYDGKITVELKGDEISETSIVSAALNIGDTPAHQKPGAMQ